MRFAYLPGSYVGTWALFLFGAGLRFLQEGDPERFGQYREVVITDLGQRLIIDRQIEKLCRDAPSRRPAYLGCFEPAVLRYSTTDVENYLPQRTTHRHLNQTCIVHLPGQSEYLRSFAFFGAY